MRLACGCVRARVSGSVCESVRNCESECEWFALCSLDFFQLQFAVIKSAFVAFFSSFLSPFLNVFLSDFFCVYFCFNYIAVI